MSQLNNNFKQVVTYDLTSQESMPSAWLRLPLA